MKSLIIYDSQFGNTKLIAEEIAGVLGELGPVNVVRTGEVSPPVFDGIGLLVVGCPTIGHGLSPEMKRLLETTQTLPQTLNRPLALAFDTRINWPRWLSGSAADKVAHLLEGMGYPMLAHPESFIVTGGEGPLAEGEQARAAAWARTAVEQLEMATPVR
jgi:flavodoxin